MDAILGAGYTDIRRSKSGANDYEAMDSSPEPIKPIQKTNKLALLSLVIELISLCILLSPILATYYHPVILWRHGCYRNFWGLCQPYSVAISFINILNEIKFHSEILFLTGAFLGLVSLILGIVSLVQIKRKNQPGFAQVLEKGAWMATLGIILEIIQFIYEILLVSFIILISFSGP